jgi:DNA-binding CsgD family transcriptional regulator
MGHARAFSLFERLVRDAQSASGLADFRAHMLEALLEDLGGESAAFFQPGATDLSQVAGVGSSVAFIDRYLRERVRYEKSNRPMFLALERGPALDHEVYTARERDRLEVYDEVLNPQGAHSVMAGWVAHRGRKLGVVVLKRHGRSRDFVARDLSALAQRLPALALAEAGLRFDSGSRPPPSVGQLSRREGEVAALCCRGMQNGEIALLLGTSRHTVKNQMRRVLEKVGVSNRTELATALARAEDRH